MKSIGLIISLLLYSIIYGQGEGNIWYFGINAGIDFNGGTPVVLTGGALSTYEGSASISDNAGNLLFYTDGVTVWNKNHNVMPNGTGLKGNTSSTQSATIVKKPGSNSIYYIFTVSTQGNSDGMQYAIVDITLQGGLGDVTNLSTPVLAPVCEKLAIIRHQNQIDYWVVVHLYDGGNSFYSYLLTSSGLNMTPVISNVGSLIPISTNNYNTIGYIKASLGGSKIASANNYLNDLGLFDFDNSTGILSNAMTFTNFGGNGPYGVEFSPNSNILYVTDDNSTSAKIYQYDLSSGVYAIINASKQAIASNTKTGALQIAPDQKIYHAPFGEYSLGVISNPNVLGLGCNYVVGGFSLAGNRCWLGLPSFFNDFITVIDQKEKIEIEVLIYPNPAFNEVTIQSISKIDKVTITDVFGKNIKSEVPFNNVISINDLSSGIYLIKVTCGEDLVIKKIVKN